MDEVLSNLFRDLIWCAERSVAVWRVSFNNCDNLLRRQLDEGFTNTVFNLGDWNWLAVRQLGNTVDIVHALKVFRLPRVNFQDDLVSSFDVLEVVTNRGGRNDVAVLKDAHYLNNGDLEVTIEALFNLLTRVRKVNILVQDLASVSLVTQNWIGVIRGTETQCVCFRQYTVTIRSGRCARVQVNLELFALFMRSLSLFRDSGWQSLWVASTGKAGDAYNVAVVDELCCFFSRHDQILVITNPVRQINYLLVMARCRNT